MGVVSWFIWMMPLIMLSTVVSGDSFDEFADRMADEMDKMTANIHAQFNAPPPPLFPWNPAPGLDNLGSSIASSVQRGLKPLEHLGESIQAEVDKGLEPVRALDIYSKMSSGIGGKTVIVYTSPKPTKFLVKNGETYICTDEKVNDLPNCASKEIFTIKNKLDYCYSRSFVNVNDNICISSSPDGGLSVVSINNKVFCSASGNREALLIKNDEYKKLCGRSPLNATFAYYPDPVNPLAVKIPSDNRFVKCFAIKNGACLFEGNYAFGNNFN